jgi:nucleoid-associated protein YgaU
MSVRRSLDATDLVLVRGLDEALSDVAMTVGALCVAWVVLAVAAALLAALPGSVGRSAQALARAITPALVHRAIALALGTALSAATVPQAPANAALTAGTATTTAPAGWPDLPLLDRPASPTPTPHPAPPRAPAVIVQSGDCLWSIAAKGLPADASDAQIDDEWRRWYAANRAVVGADPDLIYPGQVLTAPL